MVCAARLRCGRCGRFEGDHDGVPEDGRCARQDGGGDVTGSSSALIVLVGELLAEGGACKIECESERERGRRRVERGAAAAYSSTPDPDECVVVGPGCDRGRRERDVAGGLSAVGGTGYVKRRGGVGAAVVHDAGIGKRCTRKKPGKGLSDVGGGGDFVLNDLVSCSAAGKLRDGDAPAVEAGHGGA